MKLLLNGQSIEIEQRDLIELLRSHGIDPERSGIAVALNGDILPRARWAEQLLDENDELEVITAMQGG